MLYPLIDLKIAESFAPGQPVWTAHAVSFDRLKDSRKCSRSRSVIALVYTGV